MIVSDAGPIVVFARIDRLSLLGEVTGTLLIPDAVHSEIFANKGAMPGASEVAQATWIQRAHVANRSIVIRCQIFYMKASEKRSRSRKSKARNCWLMKFAHDERR